MVRNSNNLRRYTLRRQIYHMLKEQILDQTLPAGTRIMEDEIAEEFGVSRTPVREAVSQLEMEGLVRVKPRRGVFVTKISPKTLYGVLQVREALEALAVTIVAEDSQESQIRLLDRLNDKYAQCYVEGRFEDCIKIDRQFHEEIGKITGNEKLIDFLEDISNVVQMTRMMNCRRPENIELTIIEHKEIVEALRNKEPLGAETALRKHLQRVGKNLLDEECDQGETDEGIHMSEVTESLSSTQP